MATLDSVRFDTADWQPVQKTDQISIWGDNIKDLRSVLSLEIFQAPPEIPVKLEDLNGIRFIYRTLANQSGGGLVSAEVIERKGVKMIKTIFKVPQPSRGMVYVGSITIPFARFSYVVKIESVELGMTGLREAVILDRMLGEGSELDPATGSVKGWAKDPYDSLGDYPMMPNIAEEEKYDDEFPQHALSKVRKCLKGIEETIDFAPEILESERFA